MAAKAVQFNTQNTDNSPMARLLAGHKKPLITFKKGDLIKGVIIKLTPHEITVDINGKTEAVVLEKDKKILKNLLSQLKVGDTVEVSVLNPESDMGHTVVSLRRFLENQTWGMLANLQKDKKSVRIIVSAATKGGYIVSIKDGVSGFLPFSQTSFLEEQDDLVGKTIEVKVVDLNRSSRKIIFSQKAMTGVEDFEDVAKIFTKGKKITGTATNITAFGIFISIPFAHGKFVDGLVHISEIAWEKVEHLEELFSVGQQIEAVIIGTDKEARRVDLSIKRLTDDPFTKIIAAFPVDKKVAGKVSAIQEIGIIFDLGNNIEGFMKKEKIPVGTSYKTGQEVSLTIAEIDTKRHKIIVSPIMLRKSVGYR